MAKRRDPNSRHYVDNKEFLHHITEYRNRVIAAKEAGEEKPRVTEYLGECMVKIANHLAYKSNFVNYTFRDEMILDGIENCITYIDNFDPEKSKNPFAYFTQITYYAFIRRIQKEKKQMDTKKKFIGSLDMQELLMADADGHEGNAEYLVKPFCHRYEPPPGRNDLGMIVGLSEESVTKNKIPRSLSYGHEQGPKEPTTANPSHAFKTEI